VEDPRDLLDVLIEEAERGRVREHQAGRLLADLRPEIVQIDVPARVGVDLDQLVTGHRDARWVRSVGRVRDDDLAAAVTLAAVGEVRTHQHQSGELALGARGRLERDRIEARDLGKYLLELVHQL
jgi:hypothetical protein